MSCSGKFYLLHVETINLLLVLFSTQLYSTSASAPVGSHPFIDALMRQQPLATAVVQQALLHYILRPPLPPKAQLWSPSPGADSKGVLKLVRSAAGEHMHCMTDAWLKSASSHTVHRSACALLCGRTNHSHIDEQSMEAEVSRSMHEQHEVYTAQMMFAGSRL